MAQLALFGVRRTCGIANVTITLENPDGTRTVLPPKPFPTRGWTVMLGRMNAIISGRRGPIIPTPDWRFERIWPPSDDPVRLTSVQVEPSSAG